MTVGSVKGKITSASLGVAGVTVVAQCYATGEVTCLTVESGRDVTDAEGNFSVERLGAGQYGLFFELPAGFIKIAPIIVSVKAGQVTILPDIIITSQLFLPTLAP